MTFFWRHISSDDSVREDSNEGNFKKENSDEKNSNEEIECLE